jgi:hypothetical protein
MSYGFYNTLDSGSRPLSAPVGELIRWTTAPTMWRQEELFCSPFRLAPVI